MIFDLIILSLAIIYALLITWLITGWNRLSYFESRICRPNIKIGVIVPARNEESNIDNCLAALLKQDYPKHLYEVIVVDDHSSDRTAEKVLDFIEKNKAGNFRIISLSENKDGGFGKKSALTAGIKASVNKVIVTTDADCKMKPGWLNTINSYFGQHKPQMLIMPVAIDDGNRFFHKLQSLEFVSIAGVTGATAGQGCHILCNGANLAFKRDAFEKVEGYGGNLKYASGDDVFLLHKIKKEFPGNVHYLKNREAIVTTKPSTSLKEFFSQRVRWFSKTQALKDNTTIFTGIVVGVFNFLLALSPLCLFVTECKFWFLAWAVKIIIDFPFLLMVSSWYRQRYLVWLYPIMALLYPFYVCMVFLLGISGRFSWKGRKY